METKHTKGEWSISKEPFSLLVTHQNAGNIESICQISQRYKTESEQEANAKLIAAAPDLLYAAEKAAKWIFDNCNCDYENTPWRDLVNAINKATK